jgi:hypothetical protein
LTISPDGKFLAEGPTPGENIQIRDVETGKVVQTLANGSKHSMKVPRMVYTQGHRVLIAWDNITSAKEIAVPHQSLGGCERYYRAADRISGGLAAQPRRVPERQIPGGDAR